METPEVIQQEQPINVSHQNMINHLKSIGVSASQEVEEVETHEETDVPEAQAETKEVPQQEATTSTEVATTVTEAKKENNWFDLESNSNSTETGSTSTTPSIEDKARAYDAMAKDPEFDLFFKAKQAGKSLTDLTKEYQVVDYRKMDADSVVKNYGLLQGYTDEQIDEALSDFNSMGFLQKDRELKSMQSELEQSQKAKFETLGKVFEKDAQATQLIDRKYYDDVQKEKAHLVDKDFFGTKLTKEDADDFEKFVRDDFAKYINPDGTYNVPLIRNFWLGAKKLPSIQKANLSIGASQGRTEVLKAVVRPSENSAVSTKVPEKAPVLTDAERATKGWQQHRGVK